jgi:hypothetical protein
LADDFTQASTQGLPSGLAIVPLPPALLDYQDLVPEGILQALDSFVPAPIPIAHRTRNRNAPVTEAETGGSEILRLKKELVMAQTTIEECDGVADERLGAMGMLNDEIKLWVTRCRQLVGVLQVVEVERDNFKAGEGHAKELGTGFKVKLEDTGNEANAFEEHTSTPLPLDNAHLQISNNAMGDAMLQPATESNNKLEESLARQHDLQARLDAAVTERDAYRQVMVQEQEILTEYKKRFEQSELSLQNPQAQAEIIAEGQVSHEFDTMGEQSETPYAVTQSPEPAEVVSAELRAAQQSLESSRLSQISAHRHYTKALQEIYNLVEKCKPVQMDNNTGRSPLAYFYDQFKEEFGWTAKTMLETQEAEYEELCGRDSFHRQQSGSDRGTEIEISHFQSIVGQREYERKIFRARKSSAFSTMGDFVPSRSDQNVFPATWARWDQIYDDANKSPTALLDVEFLESTRHGQWPEVSLVIYSWSFYKILDTDWDGTKRSNRLLKALVDIWASCGLNDALRSAPGFRIYERSEPIITGNPYAWREGLYRMGIAMSQKRALMRERKRRCQ